MASPRVDFRLEQIMLDYVDDLAKLRAYGKGRAGVIRRFIEDGIQKALADKAIQPRSTDSYDDDEIEGEPKKAG